MIPSPSAPLLGMEEVAKRLGKSRRVFGKASERAFIVKQRNLAGEMEVIAVGDEARAIYDSASIPKWGRLLLESARKRAAKQGMPFTLTAMDMAGMIARSGGKCAVTGLQFDTSKLEGCYRRPFAPSLDRKNSRKGYTPGNVRLVCVAANTAMSDWGLEVFLTIARAAVQKADNG